MADLNQCTRQAIYHDPYQDVAHCNLVKLAKALNNESVKYSVYRSEGFKGLLLFWTTPYINFCIWPRAY